MEYNNLISKFDNYTQPYLESTSDRIVDALHYKISHSKGVANIASNISIFVFPSERHQLLAKTCGLFHDIARFEQMKNFNTFVDAKSFDHGEKALEIIESQKFLTGFDTAEQKAILNAIRQHNKKTTPTGDDEIELALAKIIRDADKIDTLNSIADYYESKEAGNKKALELDLPDIPQVSEKVIQQLQNAQMVNYADIATVDDFKLLKISWVYDVNYAASLAMVLDSHVLKRIYSTIKTKDEKLNMLFGMAYGYAEVSASL